MLGEVPAGELIEKITSHVQNTYGGNFLVHHFHIHDYVTQKELTLHIRLDKSMSVEKAHHIATEIEDKIREDFGIIATIHIEPFDAR
jgi:divalent metal cation (Fe/Co/Zn/Cd) transporter